jgi:membrane protein required for beta-lactamase induction
MSFVIVLACLIGERFLRPYQHLRRAAWFDRYFQWHQTLPAAAHWRSGFAGLLTLLAPPLAIIGLLQYGLADGFFGVLGALFAALVLLLSLGPEDLDDQVGRLLAARAAQDGEQAQALAEDLLRSPPPPEPDLGNALSAAALIESNRRLFAVLFWFMLLGPLGAAAYRLTDLTDLLVRHHTREGLILPAERALNLLDWLPGRLSALGFALAGCFESAVSGWRSCDKQGYPSATAAILSCAGKGAVQLDRHPADTDFALRETMALVWRTLAVWVALLGIITLSGWLL